MVESFLKDTIKAPYPTTHLFHTVILEAFLFFLSAFKRIINDKILS